MFDFTEIKEDLLSFLKSAEPDKSPNLEYAVMSIPGRTRFEKVMLLALLQFRSGRYDNNGKRLPQSTMEALNSIDKMKLDETFYLLTFGPYWTEVFDILKQLSELTWDQKNLLCVCWAQRGYNTHEKIGVALDLLLLERAEASVVIGDVISMLLRITEYDAHQGYSIRQAVEFAVYAMMSKDLVGGTLTTEHDEIFYREEVFDSLMQAWNSYQRSLLTQPVS